MRCFCMSWTSASADCPGAEVLPVGEVTPGVVASPPTRVAEEIAALNFGNPTTLVAIFAPERSTLAPLASTVLNALGGFGVCRLRRISITEVAAGVLPILGLAMRNLAFRFTLALSRLLPFRCRSNLRVRKKTRGCTTSLGSGWLRLLTISTEPY